jgi:chitin synthase
MYQMQAHYYIAFSILSHTLEDPSFGLKGINIVNIFLNYFYLGLLIMCFILSLGNRPQGSNWGYTLAIIGFGLSLGNFFRIRSFEISC